MDYIYIGTMHYCLGTVYKFNIIIKINKTQTPYLLLCPLTRPCFLLIFTARNSQLKIHRLRPITNSKIINQFVNIGLDIITRISNTCFT
jgi:hypothetical protein